MSSFTINWRELVHEPIVGEQVKGPDIGVIGPPEDIPSWFESDNFRGMPVNVLSPFKPYPR